MLQLTQQKHPAHPVLHGIQELNEHMEVGFYIRFPGVASQREIDLKADPQKTQSFESDIFHLCLWKIMGLSNQGDRFATSPVTIQCISLAFFNPFSQGSLMPTELPPCPLHYSLPSAHRMRWIHTYIHLYFLLTPGFVYSVQASSKRDLSNTAPGPGPNTPHSPSICFCLVEGKPALT